MKITALGLTSVALLLTACAGAPPKAVEDPTTTGVSTTTPPAGEDMPAAPTEGKAGTATAATETAATPAATTAKAAIKVVALKLTVPPKETKKVGFASLEVKDDGSVMVDGKAVAKMTGEQLQDAGGAALLSVSGEGAVTGKGAWKFGPNDELVFDDGSKLVISDDGVMQKVDAKGKATVLGPKFDAVPAWAKREAALLAVTTTGQLALPKGAAKKK